jgi:hypothetical protein
MVKDQAGVSKIRDFLERNAHKFVPAWSADRYKDYVNNRDSIFSWKDGRSRQVSLDGQRNGELIRSLAGGPQQGSTAKEAPLKYPSAQVESSRNAFINSFNRSEAPNNLDPAKTTPGIKAAKGSILEPSPWAKAMESFKPANVSNSFKNLNNSVDVWSTQAINGIKNSSTVQPVAQAISNAGSKASAYTAPVFNYAAKAAANPWVAPVLGVAKETAKIGGKALGAAAPIADMASRQNYNWYGSTHSAADPTTTAGTYAKAWRGYFNNLGNNKTEEVAQRYAINKDTGEYEQPWYMRGLGMAGDAVGILSPVDWAETTARVAGRPLANRWYPENAKYNHPAQQRSQSDKDFVAGYHNKRPGAQPARP